MTVSTRKDPPGGTGRVLGFVEVASLTNAGRLHLFDEVGPPRRRFERVREVFGHLRELAVLELGDADIAHGFPVAVVDRHLDDPGIALAADAAELALGVRPGRARVVLVDPLEVGLAADPLPRLRPLLDEIVTRD